MLSAIHTTGQGSSVLWSHAYFHWCPWPTVENGPKPERPEVLLNAVDIVRGIWTEQFPCWGFSHDDVQGRQGYVDRKNIQVWIDCLSFTLLRCPWYTTCDAFAYDVNNILSVSNEYINKLKGGIWRDIGALNNISNNYTGLHEHTGRSLLQQSTIDSKTSADWTRNKCSSTRRHRVRVRL